MLNSVIALCTIRTGLYWLVVLSDLSVAAAYFGIPITMAIVFWRRKSDLPFPWLWATDRDSDLGPASSSASGQQ